MRMRMWMAGVAVGALVAGAAQAAEPPARTGRPGGRSPMDRVASYLGLTDEQKTQLADQREKTRPQMQALFASLRDNHEKLQQALDSPTPDPATVGALAIEGHRLQLKMKSQHDANEKALRALLTPEQQTKFDALQALRPRGPGHMGMGPMGMGRMPFGPPSQDEPGPGGPGGPADGLPPQ